MNIDQPMAQSVWRKQKRGDRIFCGVVASLRNKNEQCFHKEHTNADLLSKELGISISASPLNMDIGSYQY